MPSTIPSRRFSAARPAFLSMGWAAIAGTAIALLTVDAANAGPVNFTLNSTQSSLTATFDASGLGGALTVVAQKTGSLTSRYNGTMSTNIGNLGIGGTSITFKPGEDGDATALAGITPAVGGGTGNAPADYGMRATYPVEIELPEIPLGDVTLNLGVLESVQIDVALRDIKVDLINLPPVSMVPLPTGTFDASGVNVNLTGNADLRLSLVIRSPDPLTHLVNQVALGALVSQYPELGLSVTTSGNIITGLKLNVSGGSTQVLDTTVQNQATAGLLENLGANYRLTVPMQFDALTALGIPGVAGVNASFAGQFVGTAPFTLVPEPSSFVLAMLGLGSAALMIVRRRFAKASG